MVSFTHNPLTWFNSEADRKLESERLASVIIERYEYGYSFYDWINFCDYIAILTKEVLAKIVEGSIVLPHEQERLAADLYSRICEIMEIEEEWDYTRESEALSIAMAADVMEKFFSEIFNKLPFVDDYKVERANRANFLNESDFNSLGSFMATVIASGLERFKTGHGYPAALEDANEWNKILDKMIDSFNNTNSTHELAGEGYELFIKYFENLWD